MHDLSTKFGPSDQTTNAFGIPRANVKAICTIDQGASVNCIAIDGLCVHSSGTHTECASHVTNDYQGLSISRVLDSMAPILSCQLITVDTVQLKDCSKEEIDAQMVAKSKSQPDDLVISADCLLNVRSLEALVLRRRLNQDMHPQDYTGSNPPYLTRMAAIKLSKLNIKHLLVDLPSVDREDDGGLVVAHKAWFGLDPLREDRIDHTTITELCFIPPEVEDGEYQLNLQIMRWNLDAAPSRPLLIPKTSIFNLMNGL